MKTGIVKSFIMKDPAIFCFLEIELTTDKRFTLQIPILLWGTKENTKISIHNVTVKIINSLNS